jgi:cytochrome b involved in lipid metabolism
MPAYRSTRLHLKQDNHPGGGQLLVDVAGMDCTEEFDDVGHSEDAETELAKLYIGDIKVAVYRSHPPIDN